MAIAGVLGVLQGCSTGEGSAVTAPRDPAGPGGAPSAPIVARPARIARVSPDTLQAGALVTLEGENFPAQVALTVGGTPLELRAVSPTRLEALLPATLPCAAPQALPLQLTATVGGNATTLDTLVTVKTATPLALAAGAVSAPLTADEARCLELPPAGGAGASYVVAVVNTATELTAPARVALRGIGTGALAGVQAVVGERAPGGSAVAAPGALNAGALNGGAPNSGASLLGARPGALAPALTNDDGHGLVLAANRALTAQAGPAAPRWRAARAGRPPALRVPAQLGDTVSVTAILASCTTGRPVRARVVYAGTRAMVLEDVASARAGTMDAAYRAIGREFDAVVYPLLTGQMGNPLALDEAMGGDGRVMMLFTRMVNDSLPGTAGYVSACNLYPRSTFAASNEDELLYARVPGTYESTDDWRRGIRSTVVHEAKHLASLAERLSRGVESDELWLEEATARVAEELYGRTFPGGGQWKGNAGFAAALQCELTLCDDRPLVMWKHFSALHGYLRGADTLSPFGPRSARDASYYASGWSLVRWVVDQYAASEPAMLRALVTGAGTTGAKVGMAQLARLAGVPVEQLLTGWALANAVGQSGGSWNTADVWSGLAGMFPGFFEAAPLRGRSVTPGAFAINGGELPAGASLYLSLEQPAGGPVGAQLLAVSAGGAGAVRVVVRRGI